MRRELVDQMKCPYCLGHFSVTHEHEQDAGHIKWALLRCRCFEFPIVDGVLLLSLVKGYGGSEEALAPYVPLQVAAIEYIRQGDISGLRRWIARHIPLIHRLISPDHVDYLGFSRDLNARLWPEVEKDLFTWNRYEVIGRRGALRRNPGSINRLASTRIGSWLMRVRRRLFPQIWGTFYVNRFISTEFANLRTRLRDVRIAGPVLSLCCGHGPFELLLRGRSPAVPVVSLDGQLLNLFIVKRFVAPDASYICHDVQFPLPFKDGVFSEVFSSSCLSELPSQAQFIRESRRVAASNGWAMLDGVTPDVAGRIVPTRFYRVCQNHFETLEDYRKLMLECADNRALHFTPFEPAEARWTSDAVALAGSDSATFLFHDGPLSNVQSPRPDGFTAEERAMLAVNPRYRATVEETRFAGRLRLGERMATTLKMLKLGALPAEIEVDRRKLDDPAYLKGLYESGLIVLLPRNFAGDAAYLFPEGAPRA
jgi:ubiquinone/menaquinone biosynthesis C-methylase UbiE